MSDARTQTIECMAKALCKAFDDENGEHGNGDGYHCEYHDKEAETALRSFIDAGYEVLSPGELQQTLTDVICWANPPGDYVSCDRKRGHVGPHSWEAIDEAGHIRTQPNERGEDAHG